MNTIPKTLLPLVMQNDVYKGGNHLLWVEFTRTTNEDVVDGFLPRRNCLYLHSDEENTRLRMECKKLLFDGSCLCYLLFCDKIECLHEKTVP